MLKPLKRGTPVLQVRQGSVTGQILAMKEVDEFTVFSDAKTCLLFDSKTMTSLCRVTITPIIYDISLQFDMFAGMAAFGESQKTFFANSPHDVGSEHPEWEYDNDFATGDRNMTIAIPVGIGSLSANSFCMSLSMSQNESDNSDKVLIGKDNANGTGDVITITSDCCWIPDAVHDVTVEISRLPNTKNHPHDHLIVIGPGLGGVGGNKPIFEETNNSIAGPYQCAEPPFSKTLSVKANDPGKYPISGGKMVNGAVQTTTKDLEYIRVHDPKKPVKIENFPGGLKGLELPSCPPGPNEIPPKYAPYQRGQDYPGDPVKGTANKYYVLDCKPCPDQFTLWGHEAAYKLTTTGCHEEKNGLIGKCIFEVRDSRSGESTCVILSRKDCAVILGIEDVC
jgi:hypothetical protein